MTRQVRRAQARAASRHAAHTVPVQRGNRIVLVRVSDGKAARRARRRAVLVERHRKARAVRRLLALGGAS